MFRPHGPSSGVSIVVAKTVIMLSFILLKFIQKSFFIMTLAHHIMPVPSFLPRVAQFPCLVQLFVLCCYAAQRLAHSPLCVWMFIK
jgi:hypothetical protein